MLGGIARRRRGDGRGPHGRPLTGRAFRAGARGATALEDRALRGAVERAVAPEVARRLGELAGEADEAFALRPTARSLWRGDAAGEIVGGGPFQPRVRLFGEFGAGAGARARRAPARGLRRGGGEPPPRAAEAADGGDRRRAR